jgi:hypothetical protein
MKILGATLAAALALGQQVLPRSSSYQSPRAGRAGFIIPMAAAWLN